MTNLDRIQKRIVSFERPVFGRVFNALKALLKVSIEHTPRMNELEMGQRKHMIDALLPEIMMKWRL